MRAAEELHAVGFGERKRAEVESAAGFVDGDAIDDHFVVVGIAAAHEQGGQASALAGGIHHGAGKKADSIVGGRGLHGFELPAFQSGDVGAGFFGECWSSGRGHDYGFRRCGEMQMDGDDIGMGGDVFGLGRKTRSQDLNLIIAGRHARRMLRFLRRRKKTIFRGVSVPFENKEIWAPETAAD